MTFHERMLSQGFKLSGKTRLIDGVEKPEYVATAAAIKCIPNLIPGDIIKVGRKWAVVT